eukprot:gene10179-21214_t
MRGGTAHVDRDIEHSALRNPDQLSLWMLDLVVEAAQHATRGLAVVILDEIDIESRAHLEVMLVIALEKGAALVAVDCGLENQHFRQCSC